MEGEFGEQFYFLSILLGVNNKALGCIVTGRYLDTTRGTAPG